MVVGRHHVVRVFAYGCRLRSDPQGLHDGPVGAAVSPAPEQPLSPDRTSACRLWRIPRIQTGRIALSLVARHRARNDVMAPVGQFIGAVQM